MPVPPQIPVVVYFDPNKNDRGLIEFWATDAPNYEPIDVGSPHPNTRDYPGFRLGLQAAITNNDKWVKRIWVTDETSPDWFNYEIKYSQEADAYPIFIRQYREDKKTYAAKTKGNPLDSIYKLVLTGAGSGYTPGTFPGVTFSAGNAQAHAVVNLDGTIAELVIDDGGSGYSSAPTVTIDPPPLGTTASGSAFVQPQSAVLTHEQADEFPRDSEFFGLYLNVIRIYETLPGPYITTSRVDEDGKTITVTRRHNLQSSIDAITPRETLSGGIWTRISSEPVDESYFIGWEVRETRPIPGNVIESDKVDEDGIKITVQKVMESAATFAAISPREFINSGVWTRISSEAISDLVVWKITESRVVPGNPITDTKLDTSGDRVEVVRTLKDVSTITTDETVVGGVWLKTYEKAVSDLVAWEYVEALDLPGVSVPSVRYDGKGEQVTISKRYQDTTQITPSESENAGVITTVEKGEVSDVVSEEITTQTEWLDEAGYSIEIPNLIPEWARPQIPTIVESHILAGTASQPTLGTNEFAASEKQLTKLLYERRSTHIASISFPVTATNTQTNERYGGAVLTETITLDDSPLTADEGLAVVSSETTTLAVYNVGGLYMKRTLANTDGSWPILDSTHVDPKYGLTVDITKQVVDAGATGGVAGGIYTDVHSIDKWRSLTIASQLDLGSLPGDTQWFSAMNWSFPPELTDAIIDWAEALCGCSDSFSADLIANMKQYHGPVKTRITEQFYSGPPPDDAVVDQFFPQSHNFGFAWASACGSTDGNCRTKSGAPHFHIPLCLHGDLTLTIGPFIVFTFPATTPAALPHGSYIMLPPHVERWRFGVFRRVLTELLVP